MPTLRYKQAFIFEGFECDEGMKITILRFRKPYSGLSCFFSFYTQQFLLINIVFIKFMSPQRRKNMRVFPSLHGRAARVSSRGSQHKGSGGELRAASSREEKIQGRLSP